MSRRLALQKEERNEANANPLSTERQVAKAAIVLSVDE